MSRILFVKEGVAVWASHLDLMRALMRSFRRAGIDLKHSQGFTPHPELSILMPLSVGVESQCEIAEFSLAEGCDVPAAEIAKRMNPVLPTGLRALSSYDDGRKAGKLAWLRARLMLEYASPVLGDQSAEDEERRILRCAQNDRIAALRELFSRPTLSVEKHSKKGDVEMDIAPMIREITVGTSMACPPAASADRMQNASSVNNPRTSEAEGCGFLASLGMTDRDSVVIEAVVAAQNPTLNPLLLVTAIEKYLPEHKPAQVTCRRLEIYDAEMNVFR